MKVAREIFSRCLEIIKAKKSVLLLGPRQVGKTTLLKEMPYELYVNLHDPQTQWLYSQNREMLRLEVQSIEKKGKMPLVVIDEIQVMPHLTDLVQLLIDEKKAVFLLCGSSVRKIKNLLPGRVICVHMDPLSLTEMSWKDYDLESRLIFGSLPEVATLVKEGKKLLASDILKSYVMTYLEEEVRKEALVRNIVPFTQFLKLAAIESGQLVNFRKLSVQLGISHTTIAEYYRILETCMIMTRVGAYSQSKTRKRLSTGAKYLFFDMGVRRVAAEEGESVPDSYLGVWFEQWVALELQRHISTQRKIGTLHFWRDHNGPEVDWLWCGASKEMVPIEVKWTQVPSQADARHLTLFLREYPKATQGVIVCRIEKPLRLTESITAIPWHALPALVQTFGEKSGAVI